MTSQMALYSYIIHITLETDHSIENSMVHLASFNQLAQNNPDIR